MNKHLYVLLLLLNYTAASQTFSGTGSNIPDDGNQIEFPITVSGLPATLDTLNFGLEQVCLNITHTWNSDLSVTLVAPDGTSTILFVGIGGDTDGFDNTCLGGNENTSIYQTWHPFTGTFRPLGDLGLLNNSLNPNGVWTLRVLDTYPFADEGALSTWSITFGDAPCVPFIFESSDLPIVRINTFGQPIPDDPKIDGVLEVIDNGPGQRNYPNQTATFYTGSIGIETHGNSTQSFPKKSLRMETRNDLGEDLDVALMGLPPISDFVLSANFSDKTLMRNPLTYDLSRQLGQYATRTRFCEVMLNGSYQGVYVLTERIKRGNDHVDIPKLDDTDLSGPELTGGYIVKIDRNNTPGWSSPFAQPNSPEIFTYFQNEYPRWDRIQPEQFAYIQSYVDSFERALNAPFFQSPTSGWRRFADEKSFIDFLIINEMGKNVDGYRLSTYFHKDRVDNDGGGKIKMGPVWDFDLSWYNADYCDAFLTEGWAFNLNYVCPDAGIPFWWERLMADTLFQQNLACRWLDLRATTLHSDNIHSLIDSMATVVGEAQSRNFRQWPVLGTYVWPNPGFLPDTYAGEVAKLKNWTDERLVWLDSTLTQYQPGLNAQYTATANGAFNWSFATEGAQPGWLYHWDFGDGSTAEGATTTHTFPGNGTYNVSLTASTPFGCSSETAQIIDMMSIGTSGVSLPGLRLSPNPVRDFVRFELPGVTATATHATVYNVLGQPVFAGVISSNTLDLSGLPEGTYSLEVRVGVQIWRGQVVKI